MDDIPFDMSPPVYGPELPEWWQLAIAGYEVACHIPNHWIADRYRWCPVHPPQLDADWFLVAVGTYGVVIDMHDDGQLKWDHYDDSFWVRRPPHVEGPTGKSFVEVKRWATAYPIELEAANVVKNLTVYWDLLDDASSQPSDPRSRRRGTLG